MAAGLIPIVTNLGGSSEIVDNGINGFLIQPSDYNAIISLVSLIKKDELLRQSIRNHAKQTITDKFSIHKNIKVLEDYYTDQIEKYGAIHHL